MTSSTICRRRQRRACAQERLRRRVAGQPGASGVDREVAFVLLRTTNRILVRRNSNINSIGDLKGKRLGLFGSAIGSSTNQFFALCRRCHGFNPTVDCQVRYGAPHLLGQNEVDMARSGVALRVASVIVLVVVWWLGSLAVGEDVLPTLWSTASALWTACRRRCSGPTSR